MNLRGFCRTITVALGIVILCSPATCQGQERQENPAYVRYRQVLDLLFPRVEGGSLSVFLRISPTSSADCQVALIDRGDGVYQVTLASLKDSSRSVASQANEITARTGEMNAARIAEKIPVIVEQVNVPVGVVRGWMQDLSRIKFSPVLVSPHVFDGTHYELWSSTHTSTAVYFSLVAMSRSTDEKAHPLIRWMNRVVKETQEWARIADRAN